MGGEDFGYRLQAVEEKIEKLDAQNSKTHKEFFDRFESIGREYTRIDTQYANIITTLAKLEVAIEELKSKPVKRWDAIISALIAGVAGFIVSQLLK